MGHVTKNSANVLCMLWKKWETIEKWKSEKITTEKIKWKTKKKQARKHAKIKGRKIEWKEEKDADRQKLKRKSNETQTNKLTPGNQNRQVARGLDLPGRRRSRGVRTSTDKDLFWIGLNEVKLVPLLLGWLEADPSHGDVCSWPTAGKSCSRIVVNEYLEIGGGKFSRLHEYSRLCRSVNPSVLLILPSKKGTKMC